MISDVLLKKVSQYISTRYLRYLQWLTAPHAFKVPEASIEKLRHFFVRGRDMIMYKSITTEIVVYYEESYRGVKLLLLSLDELNRTHVHYLLELVAVVLGNPEHSSHLWTHLIMPDKINMSFVPGSLVSIVLPLEL